LMEGGKDAERAGREEWLEGKERILRNPKMGVKNYHRPRGQSREVIFGATKQR